MAICCSASEKKEGNDLSVLDEWCYFTSCLESHSKVRVTLKTREHFKEVILDLSLMFFFYLSLATHQLSPLKGPPCLGLLKSQSLCVLPGAGGTWRSADSALRGETLNRRLTTSNCSLREAVATSHNSGNITGVGSQNSNSTSKKLMEGEWKCCFWMIFVDLFIYIFFFLCCFWHIWISGRFELQKCIKVIPQTDLRSQQTV